MTVAECIGKLGESKFRSGARLCSVVSVSGGTCDVETLDTEVKLKEVRLQTEASNGVLLTPKIGSFVVVAPITDFEFVVIMYSAIDEIKFLDGSFGGIVKADVLKTELDKTNAVVNAIVNALTTWSPVSNDGGAALKVAASAALAGLTVGNYASIKNNKITHGDI